MRSAQEANAKSGCFGSRNSPSPSYGMRLRFQNQQNRVPSGLAVPAEKRSYVLSARITQESKTQGRRNLGAAVSGYEFRRQKGRKRHAYRTCQGFSEGLRTHGARRTGLDSPSGSTIAPCPAASGLVFLRSII